MRTQDICTNEIIDEIMDDMIAADEAGDTKTAKEKLEWIIRFLSSPTLLLKLAGDVVEVEAIHKILKIQLAEAKESLRLLNQTTAFAC